MCNTSNPQEFKDSSNYLTHIICGNVVLTNYLTSEIGFTNAANGSKVIQGKKVGDGQTYVGSGKYFILPRAMQ